MYENPAVTHARWTFQGTTFSNKDRILHGERPYAQLMFKFDGEIVRGRLQEYIRSRGFPSWFSVTTSPSGSYREHHILEFLDRHLPLMSTSRRWRIMFSDDYGPGKTLSVFNKCWSKGYVSMNHGRGPPLWDRAPTWIYSNTCDESTRTKRRPSSCDLCEMAALSLS